MGHTNHQDATLRSKDTIYGDENDGELTGPATAVSQTEIEELLYNEEFSTAERLDRLRQIREELAGAESVDWGDQDPKGLIGEIDRAIEELELSAEGGAVEVATDIDPADHRETLSPDDDLREQIEEEDEESLEDDIGESEEAERDARGETRTSAR